jgi:hypothetical protein
MFEMLKKQIWANFQRILELFTQKIVSKLSKYGFGIRDPEKTHSGSRILQGYRENLKKPADFLIFGNQWYTAGG